MGGREAIRGFAIQTLLCILDSLHPKFDEWQAVTIEPDSANDKVDILWEFPNSRCAQQVKSSKNQIGRFEVAGWCKDLKNSGAADRYMLMLAGPIAAAVLDDAPFDGVEVPVPASLDTLALIDQAITKLDRYLSAKGIAPLPLPIRESLINIVATQLLDGAIRGQRITRDEFDGWLLRWITTAYPEAIESRLSANCEVLWNSVELIGPQCISSSAFELILPLTVVNGGISTAVVEWFLVRVSAEGREMMYRPVAMAPEDSGDLSSRRRAFRPFGEFAVSPQTAAQVSLVFAPINKSGYAIDRWAVGSHSLDLMVKYAAIPEPRSIKKVSILVTLDYFIVLGSSKSKHIAISTLDSYLDIL